MKQLDSDLVVLVGDVFDTSMHNWPEAVTDCIGDLFNRRGIFYVTVRMRFLLFFLLIAQKGNHEYINGGVIEWTDELRSRGVFVLENDCVEIPGLVDIVGVNDLTAARFDEEAKPDPPKV